MLIKQFKEEGGASKTCPHQQFTHIHTTYILDTDYHYATQL